MKKYLKFFIILFLIFDFYSLTLSYSQGSIFLTGIVDEASLDPSPGFAYLFWGGITITF